MNVKEFGWAMVGEDVLYPELERELAEVVARVEVDPPENDITENMRWLHDGVPPRGSSQPKRSH